MELPTARRRPNTYGKSARKLLVHDLFDVASKSSAGTAATSLDYASHDRESALQLKQELKAAASLEQPSQHLPDIESTSSTPAAASSPSLFEIESSEDEMQNLKMPMAAHKRRKLVTDASAGLSDDSGTTSSSRLPNCRMPNDSLSTKPANTKIDIGRVEKSTIKESAANRGSKAKSVNAIPRAKSPLKPLPKRLEHRPTAETETIRKSHTTNHDSQRSPRRTRSPASDKSAESMASVRSTPKRKRYNAGDIPSNMSSPSQLELSSLRFTPEPSVKDKLWSLDLDNSDSSATSPKRARSRLVDRLDDAKASSSQDDFKTTDVITSLRKTKGLDHASAPTKSASSTSLQARPNVERTSIGQSGTSQSKPRMTYGKQRSHLSDVVDSIESDSRHGSQKSLQQLASQADSQSTMGSQFELEDDDMDEQPASSQLKSIHELRQAGAVTRYDRDLDTLLEDIDNDSKALRLQGLMQLVRKLQEQAFKRHVLDSGKLPRLTACARPDLDLPSGMILLLALWTLAVSEASSAKTSSQIYQSLLQMPPGLLGESRPISDIARDRKENLSKSLIRDLIEFEAHVLEQSIKGDRKTSHIIISRVSMRCYEYTLNKVAGLGEAVPEPPSAIVDAMLLSLGEHIKQLEENSNQDEHVECIRLLLSWLELSSACSTTGGRVANSKQCRNLARSLADILRWARTGQAAIEQSCLRLVVSLSNNDTPVCEEFASTRLVNGIFMVVEDHFLQLAESATKETELDKSKLNKVILALGSLLNFAECSESARRDMMATDGSGQNHVDKMVAIFNQHVDDTAEALTIDQTQVMVAFGYISMLLCTLCLDSVLRDQLSPKIKGVQLEELYKAVETFLGLMRAVETSSDGEDTSSAFTERFNAILELVKGNMAT